MSAAASHQLGQISALWVWSRCRGGRNRSSRIVRGALRGRGLLDLPGKGSVKCPMGIYWRLTPAMTTSYFSSVPPGSNFGVRRGRGGANEERTRRSRDEKLVSVKSGIVLESRQ